MTSRFPRRRWTRLLMALVVLPIFAASGAAGYYYGRFATLIDARLQGERIRAIPRVYGRPLAFRSGLTVGSADVVQRLNDLGYTSRDTAREPGEFATGGDVVEIVPRGGANAGRHVRLEWTPEPAPAGPPAPSPPRTPAKIGEPNPVGRSAVSMMSGCAALSVRATLLRSNHQRAALSQANGWPAEGLRWPSANALCRHPMPCSAWRRAACCPCAVTERVPLDPAPSAASSRCGPRAAAYATAATELRVSRQADEARSFMGE